MFIRKLIDAIHQGLDDPEFSFHQLSEAVHLSNMQVNSKLKALTGRTPSGFIRFVRLQKARELLQGSSLNVFEVAYAVGFNNPNYFSRTFSEEFGNTPNSILK